MGEVKDPSRPFVEALAAFRDGLAEIGAPFAFIGGVAVIAAGVTRYTVDIDATMSGASVAADQVLATLERFEIEPRIPNALAFAQERQVLLLEHAPTGVQLDLSFAWLPFEEEAIARSEVKTFGGVRIRAALPEDLVIYKMVAGRPQDLSDVSSLLLLYGADMGIDRVRQVVAEFAQVLDTPALTDALEAALRETGYGG